MPCAIIKNEKYLMEFNSVFRIALHNLCSMPLSMGYSTYVWHLQNYINIYVQCNAWYLHYIPFESFTVKSSFVESYVVYANGNTVIIIIWMAYKSNYIRIDFCFMRILYFNGWVRCNWYYLANITIFHNAVWSPSCLFKK